MIFIFGTSPVEKDFGPCDEVTCPHCNNTKFWSLKRTTQFISFFFIPVIPISVKRYLQCPICLITHELTKDEFDQRLKHVELNREALSNNFTENQYQERKNQL